MFVYTVCVSVCMCFDLAFLLLQLFICRISGTKFLYTINFQHRFLLWRQYWNIVSLKLLQWFQLMYLYKSCALFHSLFHLDILHTSTVHVPLAVGSFLFKWPLIKTVLSLSCFVYSRKNQDVSLYERLK